MDMKMKELIGNLRQKQQDLAAGKEKLDKLTAKAIGLKNDIPNLLRVVEKMRAAKDTAISSFAADEINQLKLDEARVAFEKATKAHVEAEEVLSAVDKHIRQAQGDIPRLSDAMVAAQRMLWRHILEDLQVKIRNQVRDDMARVIAASVLCGADVRLYGSVITGTFGAFTEKEIKDLCNDLKAEYLTA